MDASHRIFNLYMHDYISKQDWKKTARALVIEAQIAPHTKPPLDVPQGFLSEWWTVFYAVLGSALQASATTGGDIMLLNLYVYDCLFKQGFHESAGAFLIDADINPQRKPPVDTRQGYLFECWTTFWELFGAKRGSSDSPDAVTYVQMRGQQQRHAGIQRGRSSGAIRSAQHLGFTPMRSTDAQDASSSSNVQEENATGFRSSIDCGQMRRSTALPARIPSRRATVGGALTSRSGSRLTDIDTSSRSINHFRPSRGSTDMPARIHTNGRYLESQQLTDSPTPSDSGILDRTLQPFSRPSTVDPWLMNWFGHDPLSDMAQLNSEPTVSPNWPSPEGGEGSRTDFLSGSQRGFSTMNSQPMRDSEMNFYVDEG